MLEFLRHYSGSVFQSVLLHGLLVGLLVALSQFSLPRKAETVQPLPLDAAVVDARILHAAAAAVNAAAEAKAEAETEARQAALMKRTEAAKEVAIQRASEAKAIAAADANQAAATQRTVELKRAADAKSAAAKVAAEAKATAYAKASANAKATANAKAAANAEAAANAKAVAEAKKAADAKRMGEVKHAADARRKAEGEAELRRQMAEEEHLSALEAGPLMERYKASLQNRITHAWIKPASARVGIDCVVAVTQAPNGEVTNARVTECNGDAAVRQSIENAVYRASPLPEPPDPALFQRNFSFRFKPN